MCTFLDQRLDTIADQLIPYFRETHPEVTGPLSDKILRHRIFVGLARARQWDVQSWFGLTVFVALMFEIAPDFDTHPTLRAHLAHTARDVDARLGDIDGALDDDGWEALAVTADPALWEDPA